MIFNKKHTIRSMRQNGHHKYKKFREQYPYFRYVNYHYQLAEDGLHISFTFDLAGKYTFTPSLKLVHRDFFNMENISAEELSAMVFHIGMVELISYWKLTCSPQLIVEPHSLSPEQIAWWKKLYYNGLGEFFYLNDIRAEADGFMQIVTKGEPPAGIKTKLNGEKVIVPIGGGKDSVVTLELLKDKGFRVFPMMLNPREASVRTVETAGFKMSESIVLERSLDPLMLELNEKGFLNGHTPFSALLAFVNVLTAVVSGAKYIALSNENSANESTVPGTDINHQYSKSFEFEEDFRQYCREYVHSGLHYFSFLRPLNELQIARLFSGFPQHFEGFRSCNAGSKNDSWCGRCPKCLFTRIILAPFAPEEKLQKIFDGELLDDASLENTFKELTGALPVKPFECVGTPDEINAAIGYVYGKKKKDQLPALLKEYNFSRHEKDHFSGLLRSFTFEHLLPAPFLKILLQHLDIPVSERFGMFIKGKFGQDPKILILGFGKEGQSSYRFLRKWYPKLHLYIADQNASVKESDLLRNDKNVSVRTGAGYQAGLDNYGLIIKSPGVKPETPEINGMLSSQTALFLEFFNDQTIGVTGTKGKSTTSSLIHHILKRSGKKVLLIGNIGIPPFDMIEKTDDETLVVFEMSAHQLENVKHSPHVAVLLNVYPEHLDHFTGFDAYRKAKYKVLKFQKSTDVAVMHQDFAIETQGKSIVFGPEKGRGTDATVEGNKLMFWNTGEKFEWEGGRDRLTGKHNLLNMLAAVLVVKQYGIETAEAFAQISSFRVLPHRLEFAGSYHGIDFYNDSISTVPESTLAAVDALKNVKTLILGGYDRGLDYRQMVEKLNDSDVENFLFLGRAGEVMRELFLSIHSTKKLVQVETIDEAVTYAVKVTASGICLLSPAAASYDQFHNFEHRGEAFRKAIGGLA